MRQPIQLPATERPTLVVLIDVEEEFDWNAGFDRNATGVTHVADLIDGLAVFEPFGIVPAAVLTYPVVDDAAAAAMLREQVEAGRIIPGSHLHPWVTPPYEEDVTPYNSFPGNLDARLEGAKLAALTGRIEEALGIRPRIYQAGRYGTGPNTADLLETQGYLVSTSFDPPFDFSAEGGPDFSRESCAPFWFGRSSSLLEIPVTGAFVGALATCGSWLHRKITSPPLLWTRLPGALARCRLLERVRLSPEGHSLDDLQRLTRALLRQGMRTFLFSFHSPTLKPGCTQYVLDRAERDAFLERCRAYFDFFLGDLGGRTATPLEVRARLLKESAPSVAVADGAHR